jgi:hypothetical protein
MPIPFSKAQQHIAVLWLCGGAFVMVILIVQSIVGDWGASTSDAWGWLLPNIVPTLTLIVGAFVAEVGSATKPSEVSKFLYYLCGGLSGFYLINVLFILCAGNFVPMKPLELMKMSGLWLGPMQGVVSAAIGVFFVKRADAGLT